MSIRHPLFGTPLPSGWRLVKTDDVKAPEKSSCVAGPFGSNISSKFFVDSGVPIIRGSNLRDDLTRFVAEKFAFVSSEQALKYPAQHVRGGDLVFTCWGTVGQVGLIPANGPYPEYIISNKQLKLRPNLELCDSVYLFFYFACPQMIGHIRGKEIGAAVPGINLGILKELPVVLPPIAVQRRIAKILSAYDNLIENNLRRIRILEEMAQTLYREWFVEFRFPGHTNTRRGASAAGPIPTGWKAQPLGDLADVYRGRSYASTDLADEGGLPFVNLKCIDRDGGFRRHGLKRYTGEFKDHHRVKKGDIVVAVTDMTQERRIVARAAWVPTLDKEHGVFSMDLVRVEPKPEIPKPFLYCFLRFSNFADEVKQHANGVNVLHLSPDRISTYLLRVPPTALMSCFSKSVESILESIDNLENQTDNLRQTRDLLLPRLLSGKTPVAEAALAA